MGLGLPLLVAFPAVTATAATMAATMGDQAAQVTMHFLARGAVEREVGPVTALANGWEIAVQKLKAGAALVLLVGILGAVAGPAAHRPRKSDPSAAPPKVPKRDQTEARQDRTDGRGEALPEGASLRFGSARLRHGGAIYASSLSPDGKALATAGSSSVILWDLDTGKALHRFPCDRGNTFSCPGLAFSPDGTRLAYVRGTFFACVWDLQTGKELRWFERRFKDGLGKFWSAHCQFTKGGKELVLVSREAIETWDVESGQMTTSVPVAGTKTLSPDGMVYVRNLETAVILGEVATGKEVRRLEVATKLDGLENGIAFSPDGKTLALVHEQKEVQLRETAGGKVLASFPLPDSAHRALIADGGQDWGYRVTFSTDGKVLLLGTIGGLIHRWDVATGKELPPLSQHSCGVVGMHTLPDGHTLVSTGADGTIRRWELQTGRHDAEPESYEGRSTAAYSPDGLWAAIGDARGRIDLWDGRTGKLVRVLQRDGTSVTHLAFAPDGQLLAAAEPSGTVRFWQVPSGQPGAVLRREPAQGEWFCNGLVFSPDGRSLCLSDYPRQIRVVEVANRKVLWTGECSYGEAYSPDGSTLLVAARTGSYLTMLEATTGKKRATVRLDTTIPDGLGVMYTLAFSPDGCRLAVAQTGGTLMLCNGQTGQEIQRLADGGLVAEQGKVLTGGKPANQVLALAFAPDGKWFASAGTDAAVYIWETATGKEVLRFSGHGSEVSRVAFSPDGQTVFSYGRDSQGYLWNLKPKPAGGPRASLKELWTDLAETDAGKAYRAVWALSEDPRAVDFLREKLPPAVLPNKARLADLIVDLDSDRFEVREAANRTLAELAELAAPALEEATKATSSLEQRKRLEALLASLREGLSPFQVLRMRAVQALELAGGTEARQALQEWARGAPAARLTQEAQAALARLDNRKK